MLFTDDDDLGKYGIPSIPRVDIESDELWPYDERRKSDEYEHDLPKNVAIHFFLTDHWFNGVWTYANRTLGSISRFDCAISPDFSLYRDWPLTMQMWNTYRSRWLGAWWTHNNIPVIPSVNWSTEESYDFCFEGLPGRQGRLLRIGGTFAIATMEINDNDSLESYLFFCMFQGNAEALSARTYTCLRSGIFG